MTADGTDGTRGPSPAADRSGVGSLAEEAALLLAALRGAAANGAPGTTSASPGASAAPGETPHLGPECRVCPVCRGLAALRQVRPEALEHLTLALAELALAVREVLAPGASEGSAAPGTGSARPGGAGTAGSRLHGQDDGEDRVDGGAGIQRIEVTD